ncbi:MAG: hypothetical protein V4669_11325 [Pseudomonadota bacterium]|jgi:hypothetical protein
MIKNIVSLVSLSCFVVSELAASTIEFERVTVTYTQPWGYHIVYDMAFQNNAASFRTFEGAVRTYMDWEEYSDARAEVAAAVTDKKGSSDARCNVLASQATKTTTSKSDQTDRYVASLQLLTAIRAEKGVAGVRAAIGGSRPGLLGGKMVSTFTMTYVDGGTETWPITETLPATISDMPLGPPPSGDGVAKPCPYMMKG